MGYPTQFKYSKDHEWIDVKGDVATVGITDYAQHELGDVVFAELPKVGTTVATGKTFGSVESVKAVSEIYAPASGEVTEANGALVQNFMRNDARSCAPKRGLAISRWYCTGTSIVWVTRCRSASAR